MTTAQRLRQYVADYGRKYPDAWKQFEGFRADRGIPPLPDWDESVFCPMAAAYAIVSGGGPNRIGLESAGDVGIVSALAPWRLGQWIMRFDPVLLEAVADSELDRELPSEVIRRLPVWCPYVETAGIGHMLGFFVHLEEDANTHRWELRLVLDVALESGGTELIPVPLHLGEWTLLEAVERMLAEGARHAPWAKSAAGPDAARGIADLVRPAVNLVLYLCSSNADFGERGRPTPPQPKKVKGGARLFAPDRPGVWEVGERIGAALRRAYHAAEVGQPQGDDARKGTRPHLRRAHWHGFWTGPRATPEQRKLALKWLAPIAVNVEDVSVLPATIRPVK